jgi:DnaJ-class molecular chaperone
MSLYERLGVPRTASAEEIKRAYRELARSKHPDKGGSAAEFQAIQEAHEVLSDERKRQIYDATGDIQDVTESAGQTAGGIPFSFMSRMGPFGMPGMSFDMGDLGGLFGMPMFQGLSMDIVYNIGDAINKIGFGLVIYSLSRSEA